jgi:asparagine synthase (glutamine-hydrolysing)
MADDSGQFVITFNGEIYNYLEVQAELKQKGAVFRSHSDTEVILEAYKRWGADCLSHLNGMFAFTLFDRPAGKLFCARDRYGEKPFLFSFGKDFFAFASEYKALLQHPGIPIDHDEWRLTRPPDRLQCGATTPAGRSDGSRCPHPEAPNLALLANNTRAYAQRCR